MHCAIDRGQLKDCTYKHLALVDLHVFAWLFLAAVVCFQWLFLAAVVHAHASASREEAILAQTDSIKLINMVGAVVGQPHA